MIDIEHRRSSKPVDVDKETSELFNTKEINALGGGALLSEAYHQKADYSGDDLDPEQKMKLAQEWLSAQDVKNDEFGPIPPEIASEISLVAQKRYNLLDDGGVMDEEMFTLEKIRYRAIDLADTLDFDLVSLTPDEWTLHARLNIMHEKFKDVSSEAISKFLDVDEARYEFRALRLCNIIADHAPALLTENLITIIDPTTPVWRSSSAQASILLRGQSLTNIERMEVDMVATSLPTSRRVEYGPKDDKTMKSLQGMSDEELALYCRPDSLASVREKGFATFSELNVPAREAQLTHRLFEAVAKSQDKDLKRGASERNRVLESEPVLQKGDFTHATGSPEVFEKILADGLRCGEAIMGNDRSTIKYPFTVSFLEVNEQIAESESIPERLNLLQNKAYGAINMVLHRDANSTESVKGQARGVLNQRQVFGGLPATEIKSIVIRDDEAPMQTVDKVIRTIIDNGMFIPVYSGTTGESLLTSEQFDQLVNARR